jgi:Zn-dependent protease
MFGKRLTLFRLFGFAVRVDASWLIIAALVTWTLAAGVFPRYLEGLAPWVYWVMGGSAALGLFASIVFHEFAHSLVARRYGLPMKGITLFLFGGVAEMSDEPPTPPAEFWIAIAGPLSSLFLAAAFYASSSLIEVVGGPAVLFGILGYLAWINLVLVLFNMVPAFPLDGGRVLRSALWGWRKDMRWATRVVTLLGGWFGILLIGLGIGSFVLGNFIGGVWWFLIGLFLRQAAQGSYQQVVVRQALQGEPVSRFMNTEPVTIPPSASVQDLVENYIYRYHHKIFPVVADGQLRGCITFNKVKTMPKAEWPAHTVGEIAESCTEANTITADADAVNAFTKMHRAQIGRLMVVDNGSRLLGIVALKDLLQFLSLKLELENGHHAGVLADLGR